MMGDRITDAMPNEEYLAQVERLQADVDLALSLLDLGESLAGTLGETAETSRRLPSIEDLLEAREQTETVGGTEARRILATSAELVTCAKSLADDCVERARRLLAYEAAFDPCTGEEYTGEAEEYGPDDYNLEYGPD